MNTEIEKLLADSAKGLLEHKCKTVPKERLHLPGPDFVDRIFALSDRNPQTLRHVLRPLNSSRIMRICLRLLIPGFRNWNLSHCSYFNRHRDFDRQLFRKAV